MEAKEYDDSKISYDYFKNEIKKESKAIFLCVMRSKLSEDLMF